MIKKLNRFEVAKKLKSLNIPIFSPREFQDIFAVSKNTASVFLSNNVKSQLFVKLRNGFYTLKDNQASLYTIANRLYRPSYISLESALSFYGIIPETVYSTTSVSTKATREFESELGIFSYQKIKKPAFIGYQLKDVYGEKVLMADPEKALADYLYFVDLNQSSLNDRLYLKNINKTKLIAYTALFNRQSLKKLISKIYVEYQKSRKIY
jgi:predicted transcriptional regulator of viral defense system